jgi:RNA polymerase-interacting CarD/CdnL/TRCF family regulator
MNYQIGDKVIHWNYGLGEIVNVEEKTIGGKPTRCYVLRTADLMMWVPIDDLQQSSLRKPTPPQEFEQLYAILSSPGEKLLDDRLLRKSQLMDQLKDGKLASTCRVVRDLTYFKRKSKLNDQEKSILERAIRSLVTEWAYSLQIPFSQANQAMANLLRE